MQNIRKAEERELKVVKNGRNWMKNRKNGIASS